MEIIVILACSLVVLFIVAAIFSQKAVSSQNKAFSQRSHILYPGKNPRHQEALIGLYKATTERAFCNSIKDVQTFGKQGIMTADQYKGKTKNLVSKLVSHE